MYGYLGLFEAAFYPVTLGMLSELINREKEKKRKEKEKRKEEKKGRKREREKKRGVPCFRIKLLYKQKHENNFALTPGLHHLSLFSS